MNARSNSMTRPVEQFFAALETHWPEDHPGDWKTFQATVENLYQIEELKRKEILEKLESEELAK